MEEVTPVEQEVFIRSERCTVTAVFEKKVWKASGMLRGKLVEIRSAASAKQAFEWWKKAAFQGDSAAQFSLGVMYLNGQGISKDEVQAYVWLNLAGANNISAAAEIRKQLDVSLSPQQKAEAQKLSAELFAKMPKK